MTLIRDLLDYNLSSDYATLYELAKNQSVVCVVDYEGCRDVCSTRHETGTDSMYVNARGIGYVWAGGFDEFCTQCEALNLQWIVPLSIEEGQ